MTNDDIIKLALEAGFCKDSNGIYFRHAVTPDSDLLPSLERFAALVAAAEREEWAKLCCDMIDAEYKTGKVDHNEMAWTQDCAEAEEPKPCA